MSESLPVVTIDFLQQLCVLARAYFGTEQLIIAGGAPRDALNHRPVKDIDIFLKVTMDDLEAPAEEFECMLDNPHDCDVKSGPQDSKFVASCKAFAAHLNGTPTFRKNDADYPFDLCEIKTESYPIQIIAIMEDPIDDVHNYDFGLSQVFVTPKGAFFTEKYLLDHSSKCITYLPQEGRTDAQRERSRLRLSRLAEKYVGWGFVNVYKLGSPQDAA